MSNIDTNMYGCERYKFKGFGEYKLPIEARVNEICEQTKKEFPDVDNYFIWICAVDFVMYDEMKIERDSEAGKKLYEDFVNERDKVIYSCVQLENI
jgi:hypothetical protein